MGSVKNTEIWRDHICAYISQSEQKGVNNFVVSQADMSAWLTHPFVYIHMNSVPGSVDRHTHACTLAREEMAEQERASMDHHPSHPLPPPPPCGCISPPIFTLVLSAWSLWREWPSRWACALINFRFQLNMPYLRN